MRTLKKSLCLIMALVFVLGLCTVGAGAAFTDDAKVGYTDAVNVMSSLGLINGYPDGSFKPQDPITRAEAAVIIARMMLGDNVDKLPKSNVSFSDVGPGMSEWAMPAIAFCETRGIIKGRGDGKFYPQDNITGAEMAVILLRSAGYGKEGEYEGRGWDVNAVTDGLLKGIYKNADVVDFSAPATREECALYTLNTLKDLPQQSYSEKSGYSTLTNTSGEAVTFGSQVWSLESIVGQVRANDGVGAAFTTVQYTDDKGATKTVNFKYDYGTADPLSVIAHSVKVFYKDGEQKNDDGTYFEAYMLEDESKVISTNYTGYDAVYKDLHDANKDNDKIKSLDVECWDNYSYKAGTASYGYFTGPFYYWDYVGPITYYNSVADFEGKDGATVTGDFVLDGEGNLIAFMKTSYVAGKVAKIAKDSITVTVNGADEVYKDFQAYDGIAVGDYVTVQSLGDSLKLIKAVTTKTLKVTSVSYPGIFDWVNGYAAIRSNAFTKLVDGSCASFGGFSYTPSFTLGKEYVFYNAFDNTYVDAAAVTGDAGDCMFLASSFSLKTGASVASGGKNVDSFYVRLVDTLGNYQTVKVDADYADDQGMTAGAEGAITAGKPAVGVYKVKTNTDGEITGLTAAGDTFTQNGAVTSYLLDSASARTLVNGETKIYFLKNSKGTVAITAAASLPTKAVGGTIYGYADNGTLKAIWIDAAPAATEAETTSGSYMFINSTSSGGQKLATIGGEEKAVSTYTVYIDGVSTSDVIISNESAMKAKTFYKYSIDADGIYTIEELADTSSLKIRTAWLDAADIDATAGKFYRDADGIDVSKIPVIDCKSLTLSDGTKVSLASYAEIAAYLKDNGDGTVQVMYLAGYKSSTKLDTPFGAFFVVDAK